MHTTVTRTVSGNGTGWPTDSCEWEKVEGTSVFESDHCLSKDEALSERIFGWPSGGEFTLMGTGFRLRLIELKEEHEANIAKNRAKAA